MVGERVAITGTPRSGKTTLAEETILAFMDDGIGCIEDVCTDDFIDLGWSEASEAVSRLFDGMHPWAVVEGVAVPRALRKWLKRNPTGKPVDRLIYLHTPREVLSEGQRRMALGVATVFNEIRGELEARGVEIEERV